MTLPPVRREVMVPADPATAFEVFTGGIGRWWPVATQSVHGADSAVAFEDGDIVERPAQGDASVWGTVTRWDPPAAVAFSWHPGRPPERASAVEVTFTAVPGGTLVVLEHSGWDACDNPAAARDSYDQGWPGVLDRYREAAAGQGAVGAAAG